MKIAIVGPAFPYKGGGAHHTTELAHRLAAAGHDVTIESWKAQYPGFLYPGEQTISTPEGVPFPGTRRTLAWYRPDGWIRTGRRLRSFDLVVLVVLSPVQVPAYLGMARGLGRGGPRLIALCHNVLPHERKPYDVPLMRRLLRRADGALVHSAQQAQLARNLAPGTPVVTAGLPAHLPTPAGGERVINLDAEPHEPPAVLRHRPAVQGPGRAPESPREPRRRLADRGRGVLGRSGRDPHADLLARPGRPGRAATGVRPGE